MVFPTPTGPCSTTDSPASKKRSVVRSLMPRGGDLGVVGEVEVLDGAGLLEVCLADPALDARRIPAVQLVLAQHLEELDVTELTGVGLGQARLQGVEHARQGKRAQRGLELVGPHCPAASASGPNMASWPWRWAGARAGGDSSSPSRSVPAARMPFTVL